MTKNYYILIDNQQIGPISWDEIKEEHITQDTYVWTEGMDDWQKAGMLPEFAVFFDTPREKTEDSDLTNTPKQQSSAETTATQHMKKMNNVTARKWLIIFMLLIGLSGIGVYGFMKGWFGNNIELQPYLSNKGAFNALMPVNTRLFMEDMQLNGGATTVKNIHMGTADDTSSLFFIMHADLPVEVIDPERSVFELLHKDAMNDMKTHGCSLIKKTETNIGDKQGLKVSGAGSGKNNEIIFEGIYFLNGNRYFSIFVVAEKGQISKRTIKKFLSSLEFHY